MFWQLTETDHASGHWLERDGRRVLELRCNDGLVARFELLG
jgi:hypothetical protein